MTYIIPAIIVLILVIALVKKLSVYDIFIEGATDGMKIAAGIFPPLLAALTAAYMLRASGTLDLIISLLAPVTRLIPTTVIALRAAAGSTNPFSIVLPVWIASFTAAAIATLLARWWFRKE